MLQYCVFVWLLTNCYSLEIPYKCTSPQGLVISLMWSYEYKWWIVYCDDLPVTPLQCQHLTIYQTPTHTERTIIITPWTIITVCQKILEWDGKLYSPIFIHLLFSCINIVTMNMLLNWFNWLTKIKTRFINIRTTKKKTTSPVWT